MPAGMQRTFTTALAIMLGMFALVWLVVPRTPAESGAAESGATASAPGQPASPRRGGRDAASSLDELELTRDASGQFHLTAQVNGTETPFLIDTGADMVAITLASAEDMGIEVDPAAFEPVARTASGVGHGMRVSLDRFEVGGRELNGMEAVVMEGLSVNLLGQSALSQLGSVELRGDTMVIRPD